MRPVSVLAIISGTLLLVLSLAAPLVVDWQARSTLERFDASDLAPAVIEQRIEELRTGRVVSFILAAAVIAGGVLVLRGRRIGIKVIVSASALLVAWAVWELIAGEFFAIVRGVWWSVVLVLAIRQSARRNAIVPAR